MQAALEVPRADSSEELRNDTDTMEYAISMSRRIFEHLRAIDCRSFESLSGQAAVSLLDRGAARHVYQSMAETMRLIASLPCLVAKEDVVMSDAEEVELDADSVCFDSPPAATSEGTRDEVDEALRQLTEHRETEAPVSRDIAVSIWHMLASDLRAARTRLREARRSGSKWAMITAAEEGRRKALKALQFSMTLAAKASGRAASTAAFPDDSTDLQVALQVRAALMSLRHDLLAATDPSQTLRDADLNGCLREVRIRVLELYLLPVYKDLRAVDRYALKCLRDRIDAWLAGLWDDTQAARQLLSDISAFASLLSEINNREVLVTYDRGIRAQCLEALEALAATMAVSKRDGWWRYLRIVRTAGALRYRSEALDRELAKVDKAPPRSGDSLADIIATTRSLISDIRV